mgnify:CR=1 FL=1
MYITGDAEIERYKILSYTSRMIQKQNITLLTMNLMRNDFVCFSQDQPTLNVYIF